MTKDDVAEGDVVQIDPETDAVFAACFLTVTEVRSWGVVGYVSVPGTNRSGAAFYRAAFTQIVRIGKAEWTTE